MHHVVMVFWQNVRRSPVAMLKASSTSLAIAIAIAIALV